MVSTCRRDKMALLTLKDAAEKLERPFWCFNLKSETHSTPAGENGPSSLEMTLTRAKFDDLTRDLEAYKSSSSSKPSDAGLSLSDIDEVILVGGSTRISRCKGCKLKLVRSQNRPVTLMK